MATRVTNAEVLEIMDTSLTDVKPFILAANVVVNRISQNCASGLDERTLKEVERWYAAHLISVRDPLLVKEKFENAENTYQRGGASRDGDRGIMSTHYGQQANTLSGGCLAQEDLLNPQISFF